MSPNDDDNDYYDNDGSKREGEKLESRTLRHSVLLMSIKQDVASPRGSSWLLKSLLKRKEELELIRRGFLQFYIFKFSIFFLGANTHPPERKTTQPPPLGPPALWPHTGCVKMGSCLPPLVNIFDLCIFALIRKLWGENPKKASGWGK